MSGQRPRLALLLLALGWAMWGLGDELRIARILARRGAGEPERPATWRLTSTPAVELAAIAGQLGAAIAADGAADGAADRGADTRCQVAVLSGLDDPSQVLFLRLWLAYLLPRHDWFEARVATPANGADYVYAYRLRLIRDDFEQIADDGHGGALYRPRPRSSG
jgi:hypothetical protein